MYGRLTRAESSGNLVRGLFQLLLSHGELCLDV